MRIALVLTYPIYHDGITTAEWRTQENREQRIAAFLTKLGHKTELWAIGRHSESYAYHLGNQDSFRVRLFKPDKTSGRTKYHSSLQMIEHASCFQAHLHILKGVDGGAGRLLLNRYLLREKKDFVIIVGGDCYSSILAKAKGIFYETEGQKKILQSPSWKFWRKNLSDTKLIRLPKSVDTDHFISMDSTQKKWDIIVVGRLIKGWKNYKALGPLSKHFCVAVAGSGKDEARLHRLYPAIHWLGQIPQQELPFYLNQASLFMHTSLREFCPRVIAEAMACGLPCVAFQKNIKLDVIPVDCGILILRNNIIVPISHLLQDKKKLSSMRQKTREYAVNTLNNNSFQSPFKEMFRFMEESQNQENIE